MANLTEVIRRRISPITDQENTLMSVKIKSTPIFAMIILAPILSYTMGAILAVFISGNNYIDCDKIPAISARCTDLMRYDGMSHLFAISTAVTSISLGALYGIAGTIFYFRTCRMSADIPRISLGHAVFSLIIPIFLTLMVSWFLTHDVSISTKRYPGSARFFLWPSFPMLSTGITIMVAAAIVNTAVTLRKIGAAIISYPAGKA